MAKKKVEPTAAEQQEAHADVAGMLDAFNGIKTFKAKTGTVYGVIAEDKGLSLSITPKIEGTWFGPVIAVYVRVRAEKTQEYANLSDAGQLFGFPELKDKSEKHASTEVFVAVALKPATPFTVGKKIAEFKVIEALADAIVDRVEKAGCKTVVTRAVIVEYIRNVFESQLPSEPQKDIAEFPVVVGEEGLKTRLDAIQKEFFPKMVQPAQGEDENDNGEEADPE